MSWGHSSSEGEMQRSVVVVEDHDQNCFGSMICCPAFSKGNMLVNHSFLKLCTTIIIKSLEVYAPTNDLLWGWKDQLRLLRPVFAWSLIFQDTDGPKTRLQLWSWSVLGISGLDWSWSSLVSVFFQSFNWTFKHYWRSSMSWSLLWSGWYTMTKSNNMFLYFFLLSFLYLSDSLSWTHTYTVAYCRATSVDYTLDWGEPLPLMIPILSNHT